MKWYPGDDVVDWWGSISLMRDDLVAPATREFVAEAMRHRKPVVINANPRLTSKSEAEALKWYAAIFDLMHANPAIKGITLP